MDTNKCPGDDNISPKFVSECPEEISPILCDIFNKMVNNSVYLDILKVHKLVPTPKEVNVSTVDKYRPIAVLSSMEVTTSCMIFNLDLDEGVVLRMRS